MAKKRKDAAASSTKQDKPLVDISEEDQWRIIRESGVLNKVAAAEPEPEKEEEEQPLLSPFTEECFAALSLIIPFSFLLLMMEMYVCTRSLVGGAECISVVLYTTSMVGNLRTKQSWTG